MKNKYQRMNKEKKKQCRDAYYNTSKGKEMKIRFYRLMIIGIVGILFSLFLIIQGYVSNEISWVTWVIAIILSLFSILYIVSSIFLRLKCFNNYAVKYMK